MTPVDAAHAAMEAAPGEAARRQFYAAIAAAELYLLLEDEAGDTARPRIFPTEDGPVALAFDTAERMAAFLDAPAPYLAMPARRLFPLLAGARLALGLNLGVAPSAHLLPPEAVAWIAEALIPAEAAPAARIESVAAPGQAAAETLARLDGQLARLAGLATCAVLVHATGQDRPPGLLLAIEAPEAAARAIADGFAAQIALMGDAPLDVAVLDAAHPLWPRLRAVGLAIEIPAPPRPAAPPPEGPPRLR